MPQSRFVIGSQDLRALEGSAVTAMTHPHITEFFDAVRPWMPAYVNSTFSFVALLHDHELVILASRLRLSSKVDRKLTPAVRTTSLVAAEIPISGSVEAVIEFVSTALSGGHLVVGEYVLRFLEDKTSGYLSYHEHAASPHRSWRRHSYIDCLRLSGTRRRDLLNNRLTALERELQPQGYRGLDRLTAEFGFGMSDSDMVLIEIAAEPVVGISAKSSLRDHTAAIEVHAAGALNPELVTLVLVDAYSDGRSFRRSVSSQELTWCRVDRVWVGMLTVSIPAPTILTCRALFAGSLHDEVELSDPRMLPNLRRTVVELADPGLQRLQGPITAPKNNQEQNDFEAGIAVLLYMLGFDSVRIGGVKKLSDAADIFATTPSGRMLVVECTAAVLNPKDKLGKLLARVEEARTRLSAVMPGFRPEHLTGMVVIPKKRSDLGPDWRVADERGVILLCRPEVEQALTRTQFPPDADHVLDAWLGLRLQHVMTEGLQLIDPP